MSGESDQWNFYIFLLVIIELRRTDDERSERRWFWKFLKLRNLLMKYFRFRLTRRFELHCCSLTSLTCRSSHDAVFLLLSCLVINYCTIGINFHSSVVRILFGFLFFWKWSQFESQRIHGNLNKLHDCFSNPRGK